MKSENFVKYNKVSDSMKKGFDNEPVYNEKFIKTKIKSYEGKINSEFHCNKVPKEGSFLIDSVIRAGKNYYPQVFLEECKYFVEEKKMPKYIIKNIETSSDESDEEDSDEENSNKKSYIEE